MNHLKVKEEPSKKHLNPKLRTGDLSSESSSLTVEIKKQPHSTYYDNKATGLPDRYTPKIETE